MTSILLPFYLALSSLGLHSRPLQTAVLCLGYSNSISFRRLNSLSCKPQIRYISVSFSNLPKSPVSTINKKRRIGYNLEKTAQSFYLFLITLLNLAIPLSSCQIIQSWMSAPHKKSCIHPATLSTIHALSAILNGQESTLLLYNNAPSAALLFSG